MKRSRRVVLQLMGTLAVGTATMGFVPYRDRDCGPGRRFRRRYDDCRPVYGGFGGGPRRFQFRAGG